jgi:lipopolysaccharide export system protein LptC
MVSGTSVLAPPRADSGRVRADAFAAARRHSRRVRLARRGIEATVVGAILALVGLAALRTFAPKLRDVTFEGVGFEGGRITMDKPRLSGVRPNGGGYDITAAKAMQDPAHPGDVDLALIGGDITMPGRGVSRLFASSGHYQGADESLDLTGEVRLQNPRYEIYLRSVHIEFKKGDYVSNEAVRAVIQPDTQITADSFSVRDGGAQASFSGHVHTLINGGAATVSP